MKKNKLPNVEECIAYIESTGWNLVHKTRGSYVFQGQNGKTVANGSNMISFTLAELRHAKKYGW